jgi:hypothetical protein
MEKDCGRRGSMGRILDGLTDGSPRLVIGHQSMAICH